MSGSGTSQKKQVAARRSGHAVGAEAITARIDDIVMDRAIGCGYLAAWHTTPYPFAITPEMAVLVEGDPREDPIARQFLPQDGGARIRAWRKR